MSIAPPLSPPQEEPIVAFRAMSFGYPQALAPALRDIDLTIPAGQILGLVGPTGAGKTTLCLALNGIVPQFYGGRFFGSVHTLGQDTADTPIATLSRQVGLVLQDPESQIVTASVEHEVAFALENLGMPVPEIHERVTGALQAVRLEEFRHKHPQALSGGQKQRLALAAALALRPPIIVLDEPTSQLDPRSTAEVFALVAELNRKFGITFIVAGHAAEEMAATTHRIVVLDRGQIVADGPPQAVYSDLALFQKLGLRVPEVTATFAALREQGTLPPNTVLPVTLDDARSRLPGSRAYRPQDPESPVRGAPILELRSVSHTYPDGTKALHGVDVSIPRGEYCLIIGQNGAGKSTLLKHFLNLLTPSRGTALVDGVPLRDFTVAELAQRIGYVPQNPDRQLFNATVEAEVGFSLLATQLPAGERHVRIESALHAMRLTHLRHAHPFSLSQGDRARVVVAAILTLNPEVFIFDEPTTGQDAAGAHAILELTRELHAQGKTIVVVTHHLYLMPHYARRVIVMGRGTVLLDAPLRTAYHRAKILRETSLEPTQAVSLAEAAHPGNTALTPTELAASYLWSAANHHSEGDQP